MWKTISNPSTLRKLGVDNSVENFKNYPHNSKSYPHFELSTCYPQVFHNPPVDNQQGSSVGRDARPKVKH